MGPLVVPLMGGLGNQLFQIAAGLGFQKIYDRPVLFSPSLLGNQIRSDISRRGFDSKVLLASHEISTSSLIGLRLALSRQFCPSLLLTDSTPIGETSLNAAQRAHYLYGYFQNYQDVNFVREEMKNRFSAAIAQKMSDTQNLGESLVLHIRYGDYRSNPKTRAFHGLTSVSYYLDSVGYLSSLENFQEIVIFSDEPELGFADFTDSYTGDIPVRIAAASEGPFEDLITMSTAKGIVTSNSTFSWWAAWLGSECRNLRIVLPKPWLREFTDFDVRLCAPGWHQLSRTTI